MTSAPIIYRVLIASPSDLADERNAACEAINEWTAVHSLHEGTVLLPVRSESHAAPEANIRPQQVINRDLVPICQMMICMFWTRFGSKTGVAESGTVEEIEQFIAAGKPVMMYFSRKPVDPSTIDIKQHTMLKEFKEDTYKTAYCGDFKDRAELKSELDKHLTNTVYRLRNASRLLAEAESANEAGIAKAHSLRNAFEAKVLEDKFRTFRSKRDVIAMSLIPATPLKKPIGFDVSHEQKLRTIVSPIRAEYGALQYYGQSAYCYWPPTVGVFNDAQPPQCATELTNTGTIYAVDNWMYMDSQDQEPKFRMEVYQPAIISAVRRYVTALRAFGVEGIILLGISMLKAGKFKFAPYSEYSFYNDGLNRGSSGEDIVTENIAIGSDADLSSFESTAALVHPALLHLWREVGFRTVARYDEQGNFLGW